MPISIEQAEAALQNKSKIKFNTTGSILCKKVEDAAWIEGHHSEKWARYTTYQRVVLDEGGEDIFIYGAGIGESRSGVYDLPVQKFSLKELEKIVAVAKEIVGRRGGAANGLTMTASLQQRAVKVRVWMDKASGQEMTEVSLSSWREHNVGEENQ
jgi:hypothetical protein